MSPDELDEILLSDDFLEPSSGFAAGVMEAVRREAIEPSSLPFPWMWFTAGVLACLVMAASASVLAPQFYGLFAPFAHSGTELVYGAAAVGASLAITALPRVLTRD